MPRAAEVGYFCSGTAEALRQFQHARGLHETGVCDDVSWRALVEANYKRGDRRLLLTSPNMRGDDVVDLQSSLARLGFDCGRVDGIFGPLTARALADFQSNCGLSADAVYGPDTLRALSRVMSQTGTGPGVSSIREVERLRESPQQLGSLRVVVGYFDGLSSIARAVVHELRMAGAVAHPLDQPDAVDQSRAANQLTAHCYVGFGAGTGDQSVVHFYQVPSFESVGGRTLAESLHGELSPIIPVAEPAGMRLPILRETRMPAVMCSVAPVRPAVDAAPEIGRAVVRTVTTWMRLCALPLD
jgi:N-acetylmuramoyl-L-alanine amidase